MRRAVTFQGPQRQRGIVLAVALVFLAILSLVGLYAMRGSILGEQVSTAHDDREGDREGNEEGFLRQFHRREGGDWRDRGEGGVVAGGLRTGERNPGRSRIRDERWRERGEVKGRPLGVARIRCRGGRAR